MTKILLGLITIATFGFNSCSKSSTKINNDLNIAERVLATNSDSALSILESIDPLEIYVDSLKAKYHYLIAYGHMLNNRSMVSDSLISFAHDYYQGKDVVRGIMSGNALAYYKFWIGETPRAITILDSLIRLSNVPDSLMVHTLRTRVLLGTSEYEGIQLLPLAKRLYDLETDTLRKLEAKYMLLSTCEQAEKMDSALLLTNELIDYSRKENLGELYFKMMFERAQILSEIGRYKESEEDVDYIFQHAGPDNGAADYLHMFYAMNALNTGNLERASKEIALADSFAIFIRPDDESYYRSYSNLIHTMIDFKQTGKMKLKHVNGLNNRQRESFIRMKTSQWESERGALVQQSRVLVLKNESQRKTVIILCIFLVSLLLLSGAGLIIRQRRQRLLENEERAEALQKMIDELKTTSAGQPSDDKTPSALRRAMLQQLGIIKMVAETPTEQNREMLRKISSIEADTKGELVNWANVFELIDNLYSDFYEKLHSRYGDTLNLREEQIIVLMLAGFSTKEISVITSQTTSTIYVRKSSIRKKLGVPEKEDIVKFLLDKIKS